jgi:hypothetical protein
MRKVRSTLFRRNHPGNTRALRTLAIDSLERRAVGGAWVNGTIEGYRFCALVFGQHATVPSYEIERSRICKMEIRRLRDERIVFNWDRGMDSPPTDKEVVGIVKELSAVLANLAYPACEHRYSFDEAVPQSINEALVRIIKHFLPAQKTEYLSLDNAAQSGHIFESLEMVYRWLDAEPPQN